MPGLSTQPLATATTTQTITLKPALRAKLMVELRAYEKMAREAKRLKKLLQDKAVVLGGLRNQTGETSLSLEGFTLTLVSPIKGKLNKKKFVTAGGSLAMLKDATEYKPTKTYEKVTLPKIDDDEDDTDEEDE